MKSAQTTGQYLCFLQIIKCLKNFFKNDRLYSYLEYNKLLTDCQYGFRRRLSTELDINDLQNFLTQNIDKGLVTCSNNDILLRTHGPYHRHKNTKSG